MSMLMKMPWEQQQVELDGRRASDPLRQRGDGRDSAVLTVMASKSGLLVYCIYCTCIRCQ